MGGYASDRPRSGSGEPARTRGIGRSGTPAADALGVALRRIEAQLTHKPHSGPTAAEMERRLRRLVRAIRGDVREETHTAASPMEAGALLQLLEQLQTEVIRVWTDGEDPPAAPEMLRMLQGFERARRAIRGEESGTALPGFLTMVRGPEMVAELAHDLRSPLTSILFLAETLRSGQSGPLAPVQQRQLGIIYSAALHLVSMASDVVELARGGDHLVEKQPTAFSIAQTIEAVLDLVRPMVDSKGVSLRAAPPRVDQRMGYPVALSRVLLNLTTNALKNTELGFVEISARELDARHVEFAVRDTGNGLDPDMLDHLYEPFRTRPSNGRIGISGAGLGLSICQRLVGAMGGDLRFETREGWGTRFYFSLHLAPVGGDGVSG